MPDILLDLLDRAQHTVAICKKAGADEVFAAISRSRSVDFTWRDGKLEKVKDNTSRSLVVRLFVNDRYSSHSTTDLDPTRLTSFLTEAIALTRALEPDTFRKITPPELYAGRPQTQLELADPQVQSLNREQRLAWCQAMDSAAHNHPKIISAAAEVSDGLSQSAGASSNGFSGESSSSFCWLGTEVTLRDQGNRRAEGSFYVGSRYVADLPEAQGVAARALERTVRRLGTRKGPTQRSLMVVDPPAATSLISRLLSAANAPSIQQGQSFWTDLLGKKSFSEKLSIFDNPLRVRGLSSRYYDGEGIAAKPLVLIENGTVRNIYVDTYYGRKIAMQPTTGSPSNREIQLGKRGLDEIIADAGSGVYVTSWLGGNANATTGDFSLGLRGHLIENGAVGRPVGEMNVTGNLKTLFQQIAEIGNDPWPYSSIRAPTLVFENVQFSGA